MKLHKLLYIAAWFLISFMLVQCDQDEDKVTGPNTIEQVNMDTEDPVLIADGVSNVTLVAIVNDTSGYSASGVRVNFRTTHGTITRSAVTNYYGEAYAVLTSVASEQDIAVTVTTSLLDSTELSKKVVKPYTVSLTVKNAEGKSLKKTTADGEVTVTSKINFQFIGVQFNATLSHTEVPADGINSSELRVVVKETTSKKAVSSSYIYLRALENTVPQYVLTDNEGVATVNVLSMTKEMVDTLFVEYGAFESIALPISYILPSLELLPKEAQISAGGRSSLYMTARLLTHKNNPIIGAEVEFTTTDGSITAKAYTNNKGDAIAELVSGSEINENVQVIATFNGLIDTAQVSFIESAGESLFDLKAENQSVIRNGLDKVGITAKILDNQQNPITNTKIRFYSNYGYVDSVAVTDEYGIANVTYEADADTVDASDIITATFGSVTNQLPMELKGVSMQVSASADSIQADGNSKTVITVQLKQTTSKEVISNATINFNSSLGSIPNIATTNSLGAASVELVSETQSGIAEVNVVYGGLVKSIPIIFAPEKATSFLLDAEPSFIWVKETGNLEQTTLTATLLSQTGTPLSSDVMVQFRILSGPGGGEQILPSNDPSGFVSSPIKTINGEATVTLRSGTHSGTVRVEAEVLDDDYNISARTTNVVIRSGPPYMWVDPADKNHVEPHMTLAFDYINQDGWNNVRDYNVTVYVGDRYNNPVEEGTTVYLTSTAGIITTDVMTDAYGIGSATLISANPRPVLNPSDPYVLAPHRIPNPNDRNIMLPITVPDFEFSEVLNTMNTYDENDGVAYVLATTRGCDQYYHETGASDSSITVFTTGAVIFSGPLLKFEVVSDTDELNWGQVATIDIKVYDINGNPVARGSKLNASTSKGKLNATSLMAEAEKYGSGSTYFQINLLNNMDPVIDDPGLAEVTVALDSPNGTTSTTVYINMTFDGYGE